MREQHWMMTLKYLPWQQYRLVKLLGLSSVVWARERGYTTVLDSAETQPIFPPSRKMYSYYFFCHFPDLHFVVQKQDLVS